MKLTQTALLQLKKSALIAHVVRLQLEVERHEREDKHSSLRDALVEISARAMKHAEARDSVRASEANACATIAESRLVGDWWMEIDMLKMCQKNDDPLHL